MKLEDLAQAMHGTLTGSNIHYTEISSDTRTLKSGTIFIALKGEAHDGHDFIDAAIQNGAHALIVNKNTSKAKDVKVPVIWVEDTTIALGLFAHFWRNQFKIPMIGITGSCGKTTVKSMLGTILELEGPTLVPQSSFNNHFGLPFTLLKLNKDHQFAVLEIGTNHFGDIEYLSTLLSPTHSLITNINPAHLAGLKTVENVAVEKGDIYKYLRPDGVAIINADEKYVDLWRSALNGQRVLSFGLRNADITAVDIVSDFESTHFTLKILDETVAVKLQVPGIHNVVNALAAASVAVSLNIDKDIIAMGLESFAGVKGRLKRLRTQQGTCLIDDSYNANPASFRAAIDVLSCAQGNKILVMGDMGELGDSSQDFHAEIGQYAKARGIDQLYAIGKLSHFAALKFGEGAKEFEDKKALVSDLTPLLDSKTTVLIKGSRSTKMEEVLAALVS